MSGRAWKAGEFGMNPVEGLGVVSEPCDRHSCSGLHWHYANGAWDMVSGRLEPKGMQRVVVIDPEDREQVLLVADWLNVHADQFVTQDQVQAALRDLANPDPPKPDEPTGLGAVVVDREGNHFTRCTVSDDFPDCWLNSDLVGSGDTSWEYIYAVDILSPGVES